MAEVNNYAVLHEEGDAEDGECVDRCCYVILNVQGLKNLTFEESVLEALPLLANDAAFTALLSFILTWAWKAINQQIRSLFSLAESLICNPFIHLP